MAEAILDMREWEAMLRSLSKNWDQMSRYLEVAASTIGFSDIIDHFAKEEGPDGRWMRRASSTQAKYASILAGRSKPAAGVARAAYSPGNKLLQLSGDLRQSLLPGAGKVRKMGRHAVMLFTNKVYARVHDLGFKNIPQREFMYLSDRGGDKLMNALMGMIVEGI